jgi:uncharacterized membrane protein
VRSVGATPGGDGLQMPWFEDCRFNIPEGKSGQVVGAIIGAIFGLLVLIAGFWRALAFAFFVVLGFLIGRYFDVNDEFRERFTRRFGRRRN